LALACAMLAAGASVQAQTVLAVSSWLAPTHMLSQTQKEWCAALEQRAAGKVKCNILPRAVSAPPGTFDAVRNVGDRSRCRATRRTAS
jgi:TRAP-type C4-dicarboxylate transport system substrate-binding protein